MKDWDFWYKWLASAGIAGCEYLPMTLAFVSATHDGVHLSLLTAYSELPPGLARGAAQWA